MISTGSFLTETGASNKQSELVKKLTAAWEKKNSKTARAGGASLMALSLAACGGEDNTPFSQADVDAAKAEGVASVDITSDNTDVMLAQADYDAAIEAAKTSNDADIAAAAKSEALTSADGTIYATVDAAYTAGSNVSNSDAVTAALTGSDGTVYASVDAAVTSNDAAIEAAATASAEASTEASLVAGSGFSTVADLLAAYTAATSPANASYTLTSSTTSPDAYTGGAGVDTITGTSSTYQSADIIIGGDGNDTMTITATGAVSAATLVSGVETVVFNQDSILDIAIDANNIKGYETITVNAVRTGGTTSANLDNVEAGGTIIAGSGITGTFDVQADGVVTINAGSATALIADFNSVTTGSSTVTGNSASTVTLSDVYSASVTATSASTINAEGTAGSTDSLTIVGKNATSTSTIALNTNSDGTNTHQIENLTLSGSGGKATFAINGSDAVETITLTGDQDVQVNIALADIAAETVTDSTTAGTTTVEIGTVTATANIDKVVVDRITLDEDDMGADRTITVADASTIKIKQDINGSDTLTIDSTKATNTNSAESITLETPVTVQDAINVSDFETINLVIDDGTSTTSTVTLANVVGSSTAGTVMNVSGVDNLTLTDVTTKHLNATDFSGNLTAGLDSNLLKVTGGSGAETLTLNTAVSVTLDGNGGTDTLRINEVTTSGAIDLSSNTVSLTDFEVLHIDHADNSDDMDLSLLSSALNGLDLVVKGSEGSATTDEDVLIVVADTTTIDLDGLQVDTNDVEVTININAVKAVSTNIQGTNGIDTLSNAGAGNITIYGNGGDDAITTSTGTDYIDGGAGADNISSGAGSDTIIAGGGGDTIDTGTGSDTVNLTEATAAADTVKVGATTTDAVTITGFKVGGTSTADDLELDLSDIEGLTAVTDLVAGSGASVSNGAHTLLKVTASGTDIGAAANTIITLGGDYADGSALETALETGGSMALVFGAFATVGDSILVAYDNGADTKIATVTTSAIIVDGAQATAGTLTVTDYVTLVGVSDATTLVSGDLDNIVA